MADIQALARHVDQAAKTATAIDQITASEALTIDEAYDIQAASIGEREKRGEKLVGVKMGFTSRAKMIQMGVDDMIWGRLTDGMIVEDGGEIDFDAYVHPRFEPEIAFRLKKPLSGLVTSAEACDAIDSVACAGEVIDSRYQNFKFSHIDVVADNSSSSGFVVGPWVKYDHAPDLSNLAMTVSFNGRPVQVGSSAAILGHPLRSVMAAARLASERGFALEAGWVILAGAATAAQALIPGTYAEVEVSRLGRVGFHVSSSKKGS